MSRLLLADDDTELCDLLTDYLGTHGFEVQTVHDGEAAVAQAMSGHEAIILDIMMPKRDGLSALTEIRRMSRIPILMLTARGDDVDRILGLEMGADDYLPKPFNPRELAARIKAIIRRTESHESLARLHAGDVEIMPARREARLCGAPLELTGTEFEVLRALGERAGEIVDRDSLSRSALGRRWLPTDRSLDMHISNLRRKLGSARLKTLRGRGYQLVK